MADQARAMLTVQDSELMGQWQDFLDAYSRGIIEEAALNYPDQRSVTVDFREIQLRSPDLADHLLSKPSKTLRVGTNALHLVDVPVDPKPYLFLRIVGIPEERRVPPHKLASTELGHLVSVEGIVTSLEPPRSAIREALWECRKCTTTVRVHIEDEILEEPPHCDVCETKTPWRLLKAESDHYDIQHVDVSADAERAISGGAPLHVVLTDDLVFQDHERNFYALQPGDRVVVHGALATQERRRNGKLDVEFDRVLHCCGHEHVAEDRLDLVVTDKDRQRHRQLAAQPHYLERLADLVGKREDRRIWDLSPEKQALLLAAVGGRDRIHVLLVGDPGTGKTQLIRSLRHIVPRVIHADARTTKAGLTVAMETDEATRRRTIVPGLLVLAHNGILALDELGDLPSPTGRTQDSEAKAMKSAMEEGIVYVNMAGCKGQFPAWTTVCAAMNPPTGRLDPLGGPMFHQIGLEAALASRFGLIFCIRDVPNRERDQKRIQARRGELEVQDILEVHEVAKLIQDARYDERGRPRHVAWTGEATLLLDEFWLDIRSDDNEAPISQRHDVTLRALAEASAKLHFRDQVLIEDAARAIDTMSASLRSLGAMPAEGRVDGDLLEYGKPMKVQENLRLVRRLVADVVNDRRKEGSQSEWARLEDLVEPAEVHKMDRATLTACLEELLRTNQLYRRGGGGTYAPLS